MRYFKTPVVLFLLMALLPVRAEDGAAPKHQNFFASVVARLSLGDPVQSGQVVLIPLIIDKAPASLAIAPGVGASELTFVEPRWPERRYNVDVTNGGKRPALLMGGTILVGGKLDRMAPRDLIIPPGKTQEVHMLPAEYQRRYRSKPLAFRMHPTPAPPYLRERAISNPSRNLVPTFVSHFLNFRPSDDDRLSLAAIDEAPALAKYCVTCQAAFASFPDIAGKRVVGFITAVRGRVYSAEVFGDHALLLSSFEALVRAHIYAAAAIELRAERVGFPLPKSDADALAKATKMAAALLTTLQTKLRYRPFAVPSGTAGSALLFKAGGTNGYATGYGDRLVHALVFPYDPFEQRLYAKPLQPPEEEDEDASAAELERRSDSGRRLTEYERRLLDRIRRRRGG